MFGLDTAFNRTPCSSLVKPVTHLVNLSIKVGKLIVEHFESSKLINSKEFGSRPGYSTEMAKCYLTENIKSKGHCTLSPKFVSEMFARKKINMTSRYVNRAYTLPPKLSYVKKKFGSGSIFCVFAFIARILIVLLEIQSHRMLRLTIAKKRMQKCPTQCVSAISWTRVMLSELCL